MKLKLLNFVFFIAIFAGFNGFDLSAAQPKKDAEQSKFSAAYTSAAQDPHNQRSGSAANPVSASAPKIAADSKEMAEKEEFVIEARFYRSKSAYQYSSDSDPENSHVFRFHAKPSELATRTIFHLKEYFVKYQALFPCKKVQKVEDLRVIYPRKQDFHEEHVQSDNTLIAALQSSIRSVPFMSKNENHLCIIGTSDIAQQN